MFIHNDALFRLIRCGDERVCVTKFDVDSSSFLSVFLLEYGTHEECIRHNGFTVPPRASNGAYVGNGRLVVYIEGALRN